MAATCRVLYIEDTPEDARLLEEAVRATDVPVSLTTVSKAEAAFDVLASHPDVDVIILDWNLPGKTGTEILSEIRARQPHTPVFVLTGLPVSVATSEINDHIETVLAKPFTIEAWEDLARLLAGFCEDVVAIQTASSAAD